MSKRIIKVTEEELNFRDIECSPKFAPFKELCLKYFNNIYHDVSRDIKNNSIYVRGCGVYANYSKIKDIVLLEGAPIKSTKWMQGSPELHKKPGGGEVILFICKEKVYPIAMYNVDKNILVTSNLVKFKASSKILTCILKYLEDNNYLKEVEISTTPISVTIGCDPEFEVYNNSGESINARSIKGFGDASSTTKVGLDVGGEQVELRPNPLVDDIDEFISHMGGLFKEVDDILCSHSSKMSISANSIRYPLGGHIHVGINNEKYQPSKNLIHLLDHFIGKPFNAIDSERRKVISSYGRLSDIRPQDWGFEYRTPSAMCFATPFITKCVVTIVKDIVTNYFSKKTFSLNKKVSKAEYIKYTSLTKEDISKFLDFFSGRDSETYDDVLAAWLDKDKIDIVYNPVKLSFGEQWPLEIITRIENIIYPQFIDNKDIPKIDIRLIGLDSSRGNVFSNVTLEGFTNENIFGSNNIIGVPFVFRDTPGSMPENVFNTIVDRIVEIANNQGDN